MTKPRSLAGMARSMWLKMVNRAAGKAGAQMRRESAKGQALAAKAPAKPGRAAAKTARKAAQATRRKNSR